MRFLLMVSAFVSCFAFADYSIWDYGKECREALGTGVPSFSCLDPNAAVLPVSVNGTRVAEGQAPPAQCDTPATVFPCMPGDRILKFVDFIRRGDRTEKVVTIAHCRRRERTDSRDTRFEVAIIQHNESNNKTCWFDSGSASKDAWTVPPPYQPGVEREKNQAAAAFWEPPAKMVNCAGCHTSSVWLRDPYTNGSFDSGRAYVRKGDEVQYTASDEPPSVPDYGRRGPGCSVGKGAPFVGFNKNRATQIRINSAAYEAKFGATPENKAPAGACTRCHYIGTGYTCDTMTRSAGGLPPREPPDARSSFGRSFPRSHWMPPQEEWPGKLQEGTELAAREPAGPNRTRLLMAAQRGWETFYAPAIQALARCCASPNMTASIEGRNVSVCRLPFVQTPNPDDPCAPALSLEERRLRAQGAH